MTLILIIILALVFFGGGNYYGRGWGAAGLGGFNLVGILIFLLILRLLGII